MRVLRTLGQTLSKGYCLLPEDMLDQGKCGQDGESKEGRQGVHWLESGQIADALYTYLRD